MAIAPLNAIERPTRAAAQPDVAAAGAAFGWWSIGVLVVLLGVVVPFVLDPFRLGLAAKYLCFAFGAVGIVLIWGYGGILSLGQGMFFGFGSYAVALFLQLEAAAIAGSASALSQFYGSSLPDFMVWNSIETLPWWWVPFGHLGFALAMVVVLLFIGIVMFLPAGLAGLFDRFAQPRRGSAA